ncbi:MAG TPA: glycosyltransferase family 4 protein [Blastocatellia bacterium]|nr:glycosyltransferase family 4 protein [Blastocatellia bacterium]
MSAKDDNGERLRGLVFCPGSMGIFQQSLALQERGWLGTMAIDIYCDMSSAPYRWMPEGRVKKILGRRYFKHLDARHVRIHPLPGAVMQLAIRFPQSTTSQYRWVLWGNVQFDAWVASKLAEFGNLAFGYESSSLLTFRRAKELGIPCVLYQPVACAEHATELLEEERQRFPQLADTLRYNWFPDEELDRRREERRLADAIICASNFTKSSLVKIGVEAEKIFVEPYGVDQSLFSPSDDKLPQFSVIWASALTHTKGVGYLLEALAREPVPGIELVQAGNPVGTDAVSLYQDRVRVRRLGHINREELGSVMRRCHAHVFPTLIEGFGRNIIEAMSSGLPVITTPNCAGPDLIEDGVTGFIVPLRDVDAICEKLAWVHDHPQEASEMGRRARERVLALTEADYRKRFAERIHDVWHGRLRDRL